ncbi:MAG: hypothetical protein CVU56_04790 [Deltaproteobacteria bacterium HGW-Deltaproteobacteria-14]|jgi:hypothetical protein|nr:MAG: hypothetical protein CVU56_04790 [Deltaproteobacteria bacterium HGW-Deltaproteobacteria-14]
MRLTAPIFAASLLAPLAACSGSSTGSSQTGFDTSFGEVALFDTVVTDTVYSGNLPADFGNPCNENSDCETEYCVEGPHGFVCSKTCIDECPNGWGCKGITSGSADLVFVCVPDGDPVEDVVEADTIEAPDSAQPQDTAPPQDTVQPPTGTLCEVDPGVGTEAFVTEGQGTSEWPDCVTGCTYAAHVGLAEIDLGGPGSNAGGLGVIDGGSHTYDIGIGPDIDVIALRAQPRTMIEIAVQAGASGSPIDPIVYTSDGFQIRTFNSDVAPGDSCARTTIAFPYVSASAIYLVVEDGANYDAWTPTGYGPTTVGGTTYRYTLRLRTTAFAPVDLGTLSVGPTHPVSSQALTLGGETKYYRFTAPANATPTISLTRTGSSEFVPAIAVFKSDQNQMVWQDVEWDADGNGAASITGGFVVCNGSCGADPVDFYFAVMDFNGAAGPGTFSYDLTVKLTQ